jgi:predicted transcriptional regulator
MSVEAHIINDVEIRKFDESIESLQGIFSQLTYTHLPVQNNGIYMGCISENDALSLIHI